MQKNNYMSTIYRELLIFNQSIFETTPNLNNIFNQILDMIGLANGSGSSTLDYLKKKLLQKLSILFHYFL
jgi:hypothetical protein